MHAPLLPLLLLSSPLAQGTSPRTWIVDAFGAFDADHEEIQDAVDDAADGDTILIRGDALYEGFTVDDKALVITAEAGGRVEIEWHDDIEVRDLAAGKTLVLRGFGPALATAVEPPPGLIASDCAGTLWIEDCTLAPSQKNVTVLGSGLGLTDCLSVVVTNCRIQGEPGLRLERSGLHLFTSQITGIAGGVAGAELDSAFAFVSGTTITGAFGPINISATPCAGDGGPGVLLTNASELYLQDSVLQGGLLDPDGLIACFFNGNPTFGNPGPPLVQDPASLVMDLAGTAHTYTTTPLVREGETLERTFVGEPGELVYFFQSDAPEPVFYDFLNGSTLTPMSATVTILGPLGAGGVLNQSVPAVLGLTSNQTTYEQAVYLDGGGVSYAGSGATATVLDASVVRRNGPDCNQNGVGDQDDLAMGVSLDCNQNGIPDECEPFTPVRHATIVAADGQTGELFGYALDRDGDTLVVGAPLEEPNNSANGFQERGAIYVYDRVGGAWTQVEKIISPDGTTTTHFGRSLDLEGDTLVVGAPAYTDFSNPFFRQGRAYVFERSGGVFSLVQSIDVPTPGQRRHFGEEVGLEGGELVVTAPSGSTLDSSCGSAPTPSAFVFREVGGVWTLAQTLVPGPPTVFCFGQSLAMEGTTLALGAPLADPGKTGQVLVYELEGGSWTHEDTLVPADAAFCSFLGPCQPDHVGSSVALRGDTLVAGAEWKDRYQNSDGAIYVWERDPLGDWVPAPLSKLVTQGPNGHELGRAVGLLPDVVLAGAAIDSTVGPGARAGMFLFQRQPDGRWSRFETTAFGTADTDAILTFEDQVFVGQASATGNKPASGVVLVFDLHALITPNPCLLSGPTPARRAPTPQAR